MVFRNWGGHLGEFTKDNSVASESSAAASQASASPPKASTAALLLGLGPRDQVLWLVLELGGF